MKRLLLIVFLGFSQLVFGQVRINLDNLLSVTFPINPTKTKTGADVYVYSANQNGAYYIAVVKDMSKHTPALDNDAAIAHFYSVLIDSTLKKQNRKLISKEDITIGDTKAIAFSYSLPDSTFPDMRFEQNVYISKKLITFAFWTFKNKLATFSVNRDVFFKSITKPTDAPPETAYQGHTETAKADSVKTPAQQVGPKTTANRIGYSVGMIIGALILGAFLVLMFVLIRKVVNKDKK